MGTPSVMFFTVFIACVVFTAGVTFWAHNPSTTSSTSASFEEFKRTYLCVFYLAMAADWLQGPYVYALYDSYGFSQNEIAQLFVAGFGSSFLFGTFVGSLADQYGRRKWTMLYVVLYSLSCITKHFNNYKILMVGRLLGGVSTSLLFSVFESWMVAEHNAKGFPPNWMGRTFSLAMFGNSIVAIIAGIIAQQASDLHELSPLSTGSSIMFGGFCSPFDVAILFLMSAGVLIFRTWDENYGQGTIHSPYSLTNLRSAVELCRRNKNILLTGMIQSLFEGSMYTFVFFWTPALKTDEDEDPPYGLIFATFMVCCMGGASLFNLLTSKTSSRFFLWKPLCLASVALAVPVFSTNKLITYISFLVFEACVGMYFPAIGTIKGEVVPEDSRAAIYNLFRVPLNAIVIGVLLSNMAKSTAFFLCSMLLATATVLALILRKTVAVSVVALGESGWLAAGDDSESQN
eukprot:c12700_g1_i1.p1 GENE.c12700_g1_i1~~c12700_g1_i1.p1  ORF type:complete len:459 (+),score=113.44 c12700_g1_i1:3-1379(+)